MTKQISHQDGWIVVRSSEPITGLLPTRRAARVVASSRNRLYAVNGKLHAGARCEVCPARQIMVWMAEKKGKA